MIIRSRLEPDFYKFTMGQLIWLEYPGVDVTFAFRNRTARARIGRVLDPVELREALDHARSLMFTGAELEYLRGLTAAGQPMFGAPYLDFLATLRLPEYHLELRGDDVILEFAGPWAAVTYWETTALSVVNELYYRTLLRGRWLGDVLAEGERRLRAKIGVLRGRPEILFSDFGTRRRFSAAWQHHVDETLARELPRQFLGTSNTYAAMTTGVMPMGTSAHELPMVVAGLLDEGGQAPDWLRRAQRRVIDDWWAKYGHSLSIFLPDTFGTDVFFTVVTADDLRRWKGFRWDSGPFERFAGRVIAAYERVGIAPTDKMIVASDALDLPAILEAQDRFGARIQLTYGWGTGLTNDLLDRVMENERWFGPLSLVIKPVRANGRGLVKLSDNPAKAIGDPADIARYTRAAGYGEHAFVAPRY